MINTAYRNIPAYNAEIAELLVTEMNTMEFRKELSKLNEEYEQNRIALYKKAFIKVADDLRKEEEEK